MCGGYTTVPSKFHSATPREALPEGVGKYSKRMDKALPGSHTRRLYETMTKREAKVLAQVRTGMSALNGYVHKIG